MITETLKMRGHLQVKLNNEVVRDIPNLVVTSGKNWVAERMGASSQPGTMSHMGVGTSDASATDVSKTALVTQTGSRVALTSTGVSGKIITYTATFPDGAGSIDAGLKEAGIFNAAASGDMLCRTTFAVVNKTEDDTLTIEWKVEIS